MTIKLFFTIIITVLIVKRACVDLIFTFIQTIFWSDKEANGTLLKRFQSRYGGKAGGNNTHRLKVDRFNVGNSTQHTYSYIRFYDLYIFF